MLLVVFAFCAVVWHVGHVGHVGANQRESVYDSRRTSQTTFECPQDMICRKREEMARQDALDSRDVRLRDMRVLYDPLMPPRNRTSADIHLQTTNAIRARLFANSTRGGSDSYRMVGYVTTKSPENDPTGGMWKLMARRRDGSRDQSDFFLVSADKNSDLKIPLERKNVVGEQLRDVYTLPPSTTFSHPLLSSQPYQITELPNSDISTEGIDYL